TSPMAVNRKPGHTACGEVRTAPRLRRWPPRTARALRPRARPRRDTGTVRDTVGGVATARPCGRAGAAAAPAAAGLESRPASRTAAGNVTAIPRRDTAMGRSRLLVWGWTMPRLARRAQDSLEPDIAGASAPSGRGGPRGLEQRPLDPGGQIRAAHDLGLQVQCPGQP